MLQLFELRFFIILSARHSRLPEKYESDFLSMDASEISDKCPAVNKLA
jgi:hypothetical protein